MVNITAVHSKLNKTKALVRSRLNFHMETFEDIKFGDIKTILILVLNSRNSFYHNVAT